VAVFLKLNALHVVLLLHAVEHSNSDSAVDVDLEAESPTLHNNKPEPTSRTGTKRVTRIEYLGASPKTNAVRYTNISGLLSNILNSIITIQSLPIVINGKLARFVLFYNT